MSLLLTTCLIDSASSAVRNLNDYEIMGRKLRVDFSNEQKSGDDDNAPVRHTKSPLSKTPDKLTTASLRRQHHSTQQTARHTPAPNHPRYFPSHQARTSRRA